MLSYIRHDLFPQSVSKHDQCSFSGKGWHESWPMALSLTLPIFPMLAAARFAPLAKIVAAHRAFHCVRDSRDHGAYRIGVRIEHKQGGS